MLEGTEARMAPRATWEEKRVGLIYGKGQVFILAVACHAHANRMQLAWQSHDHSWMIEDVILNKIIINCSLFIILYF
jgi:hypothetical protein